MFDIAHDTVKPLQGMLQKNVHFNIEHKTVRKGKLMLYNLHDYYVKFTILTNKDVLKTYEVPYPFHVNMNEHMVQFSYKVNDFCRDNHDKVEIVRSFEPLASKLYDEYLNIITVPVD